MLIADFLVRLCALFWISILAYVVCVCNCVIFLFLSPFLFTVLNIQCCAIASGPFDKIHLKWLWFTTTGSGFTDDKFIQLKSPLRFPFFLLCSTFFFLVFYWHNLNKLREFFPLTDFHSQKSKTHTKCKTIHAQKIKKKLYRTSNCWTHVWWFSVESVQIFWL